LLAARALVRRDQPAYALRASARPGGRGSSGAPQLRRKPAACGVRADGKGRGAAADHPRDAGIRARLPDDLLAQSGSAQSFTSSTMVAAEVAISWTDAHSSTEWNCWPPV